MYVRLSCVLAFLALLPRPACGQPSETPPPAASGPAPAGKPAGKPPLSGPRELLALLGVSLDGAADLGPRWPRDPARQAVLLGALYAVGRISPRDAERWSLSAQELAADPAERPPPGDLYRLSGRVRRAERLRPAAQLAARYQLSQLYRCQIELSGELGTVVVYAAAVPRRWSLGKPLDERVSLRGLLVAWGGEPGQLRAVLVAERVAWHPHTPLGDLGFDAGLFDSVRNRADLTARERECFYSLLYTAGRVTAADLARQAERDLPAAGQPPAAQALPPSHPVAPLFNEPDTQHGRLVVLSGVVKSAVRVAVNDPDVRERFAIDHYYQLELYTFDSHGNRLLCCVRNLPRGMPEGPDIGVHVRIPGFFFKVWAYDLPPATDQPAPRVKQFLPMIIGPKPLPLAVERDLTRLGFNLGVFFVLLLAAVWLLVWAINRSDNKWRRRLRQSHPPPDPDFSQVP